MKEIWKPIKRFNNDYSISSFGRIRRNTIGRNAKIGRILKIHLDKYGYPQIRLRKHSLKVHRLLMISFYGDSHLVVNHKDGNKQNNNINNLEYVTVGENTIHAFKNGLRGVGSKHPMAKLKEEDILDIRRMFATGNFKKINIGIIYGIKCTSVSKIIYRKNWTHI